MTSFFGSLTLVVTTEGESQNIGWMVNGLSTTQETGFSLLLLWPLPQYLSSHSARIHWQYSETLWLLSSRTWLHCGCRSREKEHHVVCKARYDPQSHKHQLSLEILSIRTHDLPHEHSAPCCSGRFSGLPGIPMWGFAFLVPSSTALFLPPLSSSSSPMNMHILASDPLSELDLGKLNVEPSML